MIFITYLSKFKFQIFDLISEKWIDAIKNDMETSLLGHIGCMSDCCVKFGLVFIQSVAGELPYLKHAPFNDIYSEKGGIALIRKSGI